MRADLQLPGRHFHPHAAVLLVGQDRRALEGCTQDFAIELDLLLGADRDHRLVIGETAIDQFGGEGDIVALDPDVGAAQFQLQGAVTAFKQALQFGHTLAWDDDLALGPSRLLQRCLTQGQAVAVGGHTAQGGPVEVEQQAVEVVAHVLLGHGEGSALDQLLQAGFGHANAFGGFDFIHRGEVIGRQGGKGEAAAPGLHGHLLTGLADRDPTAVGQCAHDLEQLAGRDGGFAILGVVDRGAGHHFHFQVGTGQGKLAVLHLDQEVGQNGQGLPAFNHVDDLGQGLEKGFALQSETHGNPCLGLQERMWNKYKSGGAGGGENLWKTASTA